MPARSRVWRSRSENTTEPLSVWKELLGGCVVVEGGGGVVCGGNLDEDNGGKETVLS